MTKLESGTPNIEEGIKVEPLSSPIDMAKKIEDKINRILEKIEVRKQKKA